MAIWHFSPRDRNQGKGTFQRITEKMLTFPRLLWSPPLTVQICAQCGWKSWSEERPTEGGEGWPPGRWGMASWRESCRNYFQGCLQQTKLKEMQSYYTNLHFPDVRAAVKCALQRVWPTEKCLAFSTWAFRLVMHMTPCCPVRGLGQKAPQT